MVSAMSGHSLRGQCLDTAGKLHQPSIPPCTDWSPGPRRGRMCHPGASVWSWWFGNSKPKPRTRSQQYNTSTSVTRPVVEQLLRQEESIEEVVAATKAAKAAQRTANRQYQAMALSSLRDTLTDDHRRTRDQAAEKGASSWLTSRSSLRFQFTIHKAGFRDALCLRYGWTPPRLPSHCTCGKPFDTTHTLSCAIGGFTGMRHNELRDLTANLLHKVAHDVSVEPELEPLSGETFPLRSANTEAYAHLDVAARGVYGSKLERTVFDVRFGCLTLLSPPTETLLSRLSTESMSRRRGISFER